MFNILQPDITQALTKSNLNVMPRTKEKEFLFTFGTKSQRSTLKAPITVPLDQSVEEYAERLIHAHCLPCFVEGALKDELDQFVSIETKRLQDDNAEEAIAQVKNGTVSIDSLVAQWNKVFSEEVLEYAKPEPLSNEMVFSEVYHSLIHSPALETLLNLEHKYSLSVGDMIGQRDRDLVNLEKRQREEMEESILKLGTSYTDEQINQMAQRHFENTQMKDSKWASELSNQQETQKREYRDWVMTLHEDTQATDSTPAYVNRVKALSVNPGQEDLWSGEETSTHTARREESFTVHLGAQLKTMHNLRLVSADILDFCKHKSQGGLPQPQRLQTSMSLYSNQLCGAVLLVDNRLNSYTGVKRDFAKVCEQSTDFHFRNLEQQFEVVEEAVIEANEWRSQKRGSDEGDRISVRSISSDRVSLKSTASSSSDRDDRSIRMYPGDFYITRHSNLSDVHIVCHLVTDDSVRSIQSDISSRHPVILGYRNILRACYRYDIRSIILPLLLVHEMSEEMTISWCMKRAELVFKCVKGFMMEFATWSGQESRTIQFLVPKGLSDDTFASISNMLPSIFRMSNPVIARS